MDDYDDPVRQVGAWRLANERREQAAREQRRRQCSERSDPYRPDVFGDQCHYCPELATTRDHIVPRSRLSVPPTIDQYKAVPNIVPACFACNQAKGDVRSACECDVCTLAWETYGPPEQRMVI